MICISQLHKLANGVNSQNYFRLPKTSIHLHSATVMEESTTDIKSRISENQFIISRKFEIKISLNKERSNKQLYN